jgi:hypothetical protein
MTMSKNKKKPPLKFETKLMEFKCFVIGLYRRNKNSLSHTVNVDETTVFLACLAIIPYISKVAKKITRYKKLCVTVVLCITTNGNELPQYMILSRKTVPKEFLFAKVQKKAWMTSKLI